MEKNDEVSPAIFYGFKNSELVYCDNTTYRSFMIFLEWDENVRTYCQPNINIVLEYRKNQPMYIKIDFQIERHDNQIELIHLVDGEQFDENLWSRANRYANAFNMEFVPFRVMDITEEPRYSNLLMLWQDAQLQILSIHVALLNKFFCEEPMPNIEKLQNILSASGFDSRLAQSLIFHKAAIADIENNQINGKTVLTRNPKFKTNSRLQT